MTEEDLKRFAALGLTTESTPEEIEASTIPMTKTQRTQLVARAKNEQKKRDKQQRALPVLPAEIQLTASAMERFSAGAPKLPQLQAQEGKPVDFDGMTAANWLSVCWNLDILRGRSKSDLADTRPFLVLLPPNSSLRGIFHTAQTTGYYESSAVKTEDWRKNCDLASSNFELAVQHPLAGIKASASRSTETQKETSKTFVTVTTRYLSNLGDFKIQMTNEHASHILNDDTAEAIIAKMPEPDRRELAKRYELPDDGNLWRGLPAEAFGWPYLFRVNPHLVEFFEVKIKSKGNYADVMAEVDKAFGTVIYLNTKVGVGARTESVTEVENEQELESKKIKIKAAVATGYGPVSATVGGGHASDHSRQERRSDARAEHSMETMGGVPIGTSVQDVDKDRHNPQSWRVLKLSVPINVTALLPKRVRDELEKLPPVGIRHAALRNAPATLKGHTNGVSSLALSADGSRLYSGSHDKTIKVWALAAGGGDCTGPATLKGHTGSVTALALSADCSRLYSGSDDTTIKVWQ